MGDEAGIPMREYIAFKSFPRSLNGTGVLMISLATGSEWTEAIFSICGDKIEFRGIPHIMRMRTDESGRKFLRMDMQGGDTLDFCLSPVDPAVFDEYDDKYEPDPRWEMEMDHICVKMAQC